jgi:hypothetical protein
MVHDPDEQSQRIKFTESPTGICCPSNNHDEKSPLPCRVFCTSSTRTVHTVGLTNRFKDKDFGNGRRKTCFCLFHCLFLRNLKRFIHSKKGVLRLFARFSRVIFDSPPFHSTLIVMMTQHIFSRQTSNL